MKRIRKADAGKASVYAIVINGIQIVLILVMMVLLLLDPKAIENSRSMRLVIIGAGLIVIWGAALDIQDAFSTRKLDREMNQMDSLMEGMSNMNYTLRSQRHDFLNHLQVVFSLMEMKEYEEAGRYIEKVYGAISSVSAMLKTASPAVNALLQVKIASCEQRGIRLVPEIHSSWSDLPLEDWEACKVLGNLIDNAVEALLEAGTPEPEIRVTLSENLHDYLFSVENNGPEIPLSARDNIFRPGITSKAEGHGMGLYIVSSVVRNVSGIIHLESDSERTVFSGNFPKKNLDSDKKA